jgi:hypothetical protein
MDQQQYTTLVDVLKQLPDPRKRKGRRHRFLTLLCLIVAAVASGGGSGDDRTVVARGLDN